MRFKQRSHIHISFDKAGLDRKRTMFWGGDDEETQTQTTVSNPVFTPAPEFPEATQARELQSSTLKGWGESGTYGADVGAYDKAKADAAKLINQYYWGGANTPGLINKIQASAARRGVSESPAADVLRGRLGAEQATQLGTMNTQYDLSKMADVNTARANWMSALMNLSAQKPAGQWGGTTTITQPQEDYIPALIGGAATIGGQYMLGNQLSNMYKQPGAYTGQTPSSLTDRGVTNAFSSALDIGSMIPGPQQPFVAGANAIWDVGKMFL